jgi:hypothetical protein
MKINFIFQMLLFLSERYYALNVLKLHCDNVFSDIALKIYDHLKESQNT